MVWLNTKFAQAGAHGSPQIMQPPLLFEGDRLIKRDLGLRPAGKAAISRNAENKITVTTPHDALKNGKGGIGERHNMLHPVLSSLFRNGYSSRRKIDLRPFQTADLLTTTA